MSKFILPISQERDLVEKDQLIPPEEWLEKKIEDYQKRDEHEINIPKKWNGEDYEIEDLYPDQQYIAYLILSKIKEFMETSNFSNFQPLRCTLNGQAGTGKSVLINTITSVLRRMFNYNNVVRVTAPTGVAAFNVGGETLHTFSCQKGEATSRTSMKDKDAMIKRFKHLLCLIVDERSMVSSSVLGCTQQRVEETIYQGLGIDKHSWGGLPVLILAGDDYQLPGVHQGAIESLYRSDGSKATIKGRESFKECARVVYQLPTIRRVADNQQEDKNLLERLRVGDGILDSDVQKLQSLHIDTIEKIHGKEYAESIRQQSVYLFWTNDKRIKHNISMQSRINSPVNPTAIVKPRSTGKKHAKAVSSHFKQDTPSALFCRGSKVALHSKNFLPMWGLHNGACGTVDEIVFEKGNNPNKGNLPKYVVVDFPLYCGPVWDKQNPTHVPVPLVTLACNQTERCCERTFVPLDLAFARTIHKFQGLSAGPVDANKIPNTYPSIICDPDVKASEARNTGLMYTAVSRGTTLGDEDGKNSSIYFDGPNLSLERIQGITKKTGSKEEYKNVIRRRNWVQHLMQNIVPLQGMHESEIQAILSWSKKKFSYEELYQRTNLYTAGSKPKKKRQKRTATYKI